MLPGGDHDNDRIARAIDEVGMSPIAMDGTAMDGTSSRGGAMFSMSDGIRNNRGAVAVAFRAAVDAARGCDDATRATGVFVSCGGACGRTCSDRCATEGCAAGLSIARS